MTAGAMRRMIPIYNRLVKLPYPASAENMWREDHLYDLVAVMGYNDDPVDAGQGQRDFPALCQAGLFAHRMAAWR